MSDFCFIQKLAFWKRKRSIEMSHQSPSGAAASNFSDEDDEEKNKKKKSLVEKKSVGIGKMFSFADSYDYLLMFVGSIGACVHGASVPVFFIFFGKMINIIGLAYLFPQEASHKVAKVSLPLSLSLLCITSWDDKINVSFAYNSSVSQYSLDFLYLSIVIMFSSWTGKLQL